MVFQDAAARYGLRCAVRFTRLNAGADRWITIGAQSGHDLD